MSIPGFTAEASLYGPGGGYHSRAAFGQAGPRGSRVVPQDRCDTLCGPVLDYCLETCFLGKRRCEGVCWRTYLLCRRACEGFV